MPTDTNFKQGGLLERLVKEKQAKEGTCATCCNLVQLSETAYACTEYDKLIMPRYMPYHGNCKCEDWKNGLCVRFEAKLEGGENE